MGLDVYLYRYDMHPDDVKKREQELEESRLDSKLRERACTELGLTAGEVGYPEEPCSEESRVRWRERKNALFAEHGLDEYGSPGGYGVREEVQIDSSIHPKHMFKIGYFRSGYNDGGINRVLSALIGKRLDDIFPGDSYVRAVDWPEALARANAVREAYRAARDRYGNVSTISVGFNIFRNKADYPKGADEAFALYKQEADKRAAREAGAGWDCYMNGNGEFLWSGFLVKAAIPMLDTFGGPSVLLVGEWPKKPGAPDEPEDEPEWYGAALDVVVETCEWVLAQPNPEKFYLHWSG